MYIEKLHIKNFKLFKDLEILFNENLNVFTGTNNSGKSTVLEALSLWQEILNKLIIKKKQQFIFKKEDIYFDYNELLSIRTSMYKGVFYNYDTKNTIILDATVKNNTTSFNIAFSIKSHYNNVFILGLANKKKFDYQKFDNFFNTNQTPNKKEPISITFSNSIDNIKAEENFQTYINIDTQIRNRNSISVLRNRIHDLKIDTNQEYYNSFKKDLYNILNKYDKRADINIDVKTNRNEHSVVKIDIWINNLFVDIYQLGNGTIQIIELLLSLYKINDYANLNLIVLDEPDKHIHRDIQAYLFRFINENIKTNIDQQIFVTTHNESLIRSIDPTELFHIQNKAYKNVKLKPVINDSINYPKKGFQPTQHVKILESLGAASGLDIINAIEADLIIITEGKSDAKYIQEIYSRNKNVNKQNIIFLSMGGVSSIFRHLKSYKHILESISGHTNLWDKAILIFDKDSRTDKQRKKLLETFIKKSISIKTYIWKSYTIESTLLSDIGVFCKLLTKYFHKKNSNSNILISEIKTELEKILENKINENIELLNNQENELWEKYTKQIKSVKNLTEKFLEIKGVFNKNNDELWKEFTEYYKKTLNINDFHKIIDKNDVFAILNKLAKQFNIQINEDLYFSEIIKIADNNTLTWFNEWTEICNFIDVNSKSESLEQEITSNNLKYFYNKIDDLKLTPTDGLKEVISLIINTGKPTRDNLLKKFSKKRATFDRYIDKLKENKIINTNKDNEYFLLN